MKKSLILIIVLLAVGAAFYILNQSGNSILPINSPDNSGEESPVAGKCYVGGCSSQICSDTPDAVSNCEYMEVYACYQGATCERQNDGECGWTETSELRACLNAGLQ